MTSPVPEGTDEAKAAFRSRFFVPINADAERAFDAGMAVALAAAAPYVAAKALRDAADELTRDCDRRCADGDCADHAVWLTERADDIERAARAAGKDQTDG